MQPGRHTTSLRECFRKNQKFNTSYFQERDVTCQRGEKKKFLKIKNQEVMKMVCYYVTFTQDWWLVTGAVSVGAALFQPTELIHFVLSN